MKEQFDTGDVIRWEQQVRFRHMSTRKYLCITSARKVWSPHFAHHFFSILNITHVVNHGHLEEITCKNNQVSLISDDKDPRTVFRLHPVIKVGLYFLSIAQSIV